jgi:hypothetical protein
MIVYITQFFTNEYGDSEGFKEFISLFFRVAQADQKNIVCRRRILIPLNGDITSKQRVLNTLQVTEVRTDSVQVQLSYVQKKILLYLN